MMVQSLRILLNEAQAAIEALDGTPYATPSIETPTWRHGKQAFTEAVGSALDQHLMFSASIEGAPATGNAGSDYYEVEADLVVQFMFKLGAGDEVDRERLAMDAAADVAESLLKSTHATLQNVEITQAFTPGRKVGDFLPVELRFNVRLDIGYNFH